MPVSSARVAHAAEVNHEYARAVIGEDDYDSLMLEKRNYSIVPMGSLAPGIKRNAAHGRRGALIVNTVFFRCIQICF